MSTLFWTLAAAAGLALLVELFLRHQRRAVRQEQSLLWEQTQQTIRERIEDPDRLASMQHVRSRLGAQEAYLGMICRSVAASLKCGRAVVTLVDGDRQQWVAHHFVDPNEKTAHTDVEYDQSYCMYVVASDQTFSVEDASKDLRVNTHPCFTVLGCKAYLGTPIHSREGFPVGSLCVFDMSARKWSQRDIVTLESFSALISL